MQLQQPKQYQQGWTEFYKLKFKLTPDVLIPRPETELLIDEVLKIANSGSQIVDRPNLISNPPSAISIIDVGTGSGCIAVSIAKNVKEAKIIALDISENVLKVAEKNAQFHHVDKRIFFVKSDLLSEIKVAPDIIVANLPYIPTGRLLLIDPLVTNFEPRTALDGGKDGFELYNRLFLQMREKELYPKVLIAEIDEEQGQLASQLARQYFPTAEVSIKQDLTKRDRILRIDFS